MENIEIWHFNTHTVTHSDIYGLYRFVMNTNIKSIKISPNVHLVGPARSIQYRGGAYERGSTANHEMCPHHNNTAKMANRFPAWSSYIFQHKIWNKPPFEWQMSMGIETPYVGGCLRWDSLSFGQCSSPDSENTLCFAPPFVFVFATTTQADSALLRESIARIQW